MSGYNYSRYSDELAHKKRRRFFLKLYLALVVLLLSVSSLVYLLFISSIMTLNDISINGLKTIESTEIFSLIDSIKNREYFGKANLKIQSNIMFFDADSLQDKILAEFPVIKTVELKKEYPHKLTANIIERVPMGTWCFVDSCKHFDDSGILWGKALRSYGSLLISIDDTRPAGNDSYLLFFEPIKIANEELEKIDINIQRIEIPVDSFGDFKVYTAAGYYIILNGESEISKQLEIFKIFLKEKGSNFHAEYVDLRIEGRIYYK